MRPMLLLSVALLASGCQKIDLGSLNLKKYAPRVTFDSAKVRSFDFEGLNTDFVFQIENPYPVGLKLAAFEYDLALEGQDFLHGGSDLGLAIEAGRTSPLNLPARIRFQQVFDLLRDAGGQDEVAFGLVGSIGVDTPAGRIDVPFDEEGKLPTLKAPRLQLGEVRVARVNLLQQRADLELDVNVTNRALQHAYSLLDFGYGIDLNGARVATGDLAAIEVAAGNTRTVTLPIGVDLRNLGAAVVTAITQKRPVDVRLDASTRVQTPLGAVPLQLDETANLRLK